jgi:hypothetical protein
MYEKKSIKLLCMLQHEAPIIRKINKVPEMTLFQKRERVISI